jgi:acetate---CoA ligase (ADP-forming)
VKSLLNPKTVAVVGASREPQKIGYIIFDNLLSGFSGKVYPVNPKATEILGEKVFKTVHDIKGKIDLAVISVPAPNVVHALESCGKKGIKTAIIISAGFSESGHAGTLREKEIIAVAKKFKMRILGPNCLGVINNFSGLNASFATAKLPSKYKVGIFSQSGAMGSAMLDFANGRNFGFSYFVSLGNKSDISELDLISSWESDENVEIAVGYIEDVKDGPKFMEACKRFTAKKPLILLKGGMTKDGSKAASLHTAAMAQDEVVFKAAMRESGVILARNLGDLFELAVAFSAGKLPKGKNLAILSNAGGPSVLGADACSFEQVNLPRLSAHSVQEISQKTKAASIENPIDLRGDATQSEFRAALWALNQDQNINGILVIVTPQAMTEVDGIAYEIVDFYRNGKKPIYVNYIGGEIVSRAIEIAAENGVPTFGFPERAVRAFAFQAEYALRRLHPDTKSKKHPKHQVVKSLINFSEQNVSHDRLFTILNAYGVPMAKTLLAKNATEAAEALKEIKAPLVMKIFSPDILHKTDIGGVLFGINTAEEAGAGFGKIVNNAKKHHPKAQIDGVTMMETAKEGLEVIVGAKKDPTFGPVLMFGFGGIFVELVSDYSLILAPFTTDKIKQMIAETNVSKIIKGYRGRAAYSEKSLIEAIHAIGALVEDHPEIQEVEINPLILTDDGRSVGLDAKIAVKKSLKIG